MNLIRLPMRNKPIKTSRIPAMTVANARPSMPFSATMPATMVANAAENAAREEFVKETVKVCPKTNLAAGRKYSVCDIVTPVEGESRRLTGGKVLSVHRLYDGKSGEEEDENISEETIVKDGAKVLFPDRGLYRLCLSVRDDEARDALQYAFVFVEGEL